MRVGEIRDKRERVEEEEVDGGKPGRSICRLSFFPSSIFRTSSHATSACPREESMDAAVWSLSICVDEAAAETAREGRREEEDVVVVGNKEEDRRTCNCVCWRPLRAGASGAPAAGDRGAQRAAAACDIE